MNRLLVFNIPFLFSIGASLIQTLSSRLFTSCYMLKAICFKQKNVLMMLTGAWGYKDVGMRGSLLKQVSVISIVVLVGELCYGSPMDMWDFLYSCMPFTSGPVNVFTSPFNDWCRHFASNIPIALPRWEIRRSEGSEAETIEDCSG